MPARKIKQQPSTKRSFEKTLKPELDRYTEILLREFEKEGILLEVPDENGAEYHFVYGSALPDIPNQEVQDNVVVRQLSEFRRTCQSVYLYLNYNKSQDIQQLKLTDILSWLDAQGAISASWITDPYMVDILDKMDVLLTDDEMLKAAETSLKRHNIRIDPLIAQLLEFFGRQIALKSFKTANYEIEPNNPDNAPDIIMSRNEEIVPKLLLLNFNFRKGLQNLDEDFVQEPINYLFRNSYLATKPFFFLQVIFTNESSSEFDKIKFKIRQMMDKYLDNNNDYHDRIKFILIPTTHINLLEREFSEFKEREIQLEAKYTFTTQKPPQDHLELNDSFYPRVFDIRHNNIEVKINPNQTPTWRFGFRFSTSENIQMLPTGRHDNNIYQDIHLCVGDLSDKNEWFNSTTLYLNTYLRMGNDAQKLLSNYNGSLITLRAENVTQTNVRITVIVNDTVIYNRIHMIGNYKYCKLFAWRDYADYGLTTDIKVTYLNRSTSA